MSVHRLIPLGLLAALTIVPIWAVAASAQDPKTIGVITRRIEPKRSVLELPALLDVGVMPLDQALTHLTKTSGVLVSFSRTLFPPDTKTSCPCASLTVGQALEHLLSATGLYFSEVRGQVLIYPDRVLNPYRGRTPLQDLGQPTSRLVGLGTGHVVNLTVQSTFPVRFQQSVVRGTVVNSRSSPLAGARVLVAGTNNQAITDASGQFRLSNVTGTEIALNVTAIGYRPLSQTVRVGEAAIRLVMTEVAINLDEIVVTGTVGQTQKRAVGNAVVQLNAAEIVPVSPLKDVGQLINGRAPGVVVQYGSGTAGAGSRILIRGQSSIGLPSDPLVYVDGVRVDSRFGNQGSGLASASRLNDFTPQDIESIEIIKGPAAATLYGTEANNGVIQIITKKGRAGRGAVGLSVRQGAAWFMNPEGRWWVNYYRDPATGLGGGFNLAQVETDAGRPFFRTGHLQGYGLNIEGGSDVVQYYASGDYDRDEGAQPNNGAQRFNGRLNVNVAPRASFDVSANLGFSLVRTNFGDGNSMMFGAVFNRPENRDGPTRGFRAAPPEVWYNGARQVTQNVNRLTGGIAIRHRPAAWFSHRLNVGVDVSDQDDSDLRPKLAPADARFFSTTAAAGQRRIVETNVLTNTLDYSGTLTFPLTRSLRSNTSAGVQYYRSLSKVLGLTGQRFPTLDITSIQGASAFIGVVGDQVENVTVGTFAQQQFAWRDRLFLTGAIRADDNSAFGRSFDFVTYPKVSASWVISEEPFWPLTFVDALKLRAAYGESGRQPLAFSALRSLQPVTGVDGGPAVTPQFIGNPDLRPERGKEVEVGFEAGLFNDRVGIDFTYYSKRTRDAIVQRDVAPSLGFPAKQFVNVAEITNHGVEALVKVEPVRSAALKWDLSFNIAANRNEIVSLGLEGVPYLEADAFGSRHQPGHPANAIFAVRIISADRDANGRPINIRCDGGAGNPVPCDQAPALPYGQVEPKVHGAVRSNVQLFNRLDVSALVDFQAGHRMWALWCAGSLQCEEEIFPERFDPVIAASSVLGFTNDAYWMKDASFAKLREVSVSYRVPDRWARMFGAGRATAVLAARNLHTWTGYRGLDPEIRTIFANWNLIGFTPFEEAELPHLAQLSLKLNVTF